MFSEKIYPLPFAKNLPSTLLPWIMGGMIFLILVLGFSIGLHRFSLIEEYHRTPSITLEFHENQTFDLQHAQNILEQIRTLPHVKRSEIVSIQHLKKLTQEFLHDQEGAVPYPLLINIWTSTSSYKIMDLIRETLKDQDVNFNFLVHDELKRGGRFLNDVFSMLLVLWLALCGACFLASFLSSLSIYFHSHKDAIRLLMLMGASESYVCKQIRPSVTRMLSKGLIIAAALSLTALFVLYVLRGQYFLLQQGITPKFLSSFFMFCLCNLLCIILVSYISVSVIAWRFYREFDTRT